MIHVDTNTGRRDVTFTPSELELVAAYHLQSELTQALDHLREALTAAKELGYPLGEELISQSISRVEELLA